MSILGTGIGSHRPQRDVAIERLHPDPNNPRLPLAHRGKKEPELLESLLLLSNPQEIAVSMCQNGYFDAEPLVAIPRELPAHLADLDSTAIIASADYLPFIEAQNTEFIVVEGNRRLCAAKYILSGTKRQFPVPTNDAVRDDLKRLPVIVYPRRQDVIAYLGARHIIGIKKWDAFSKATYISNLSEEYKLSMDDIQSAIGDVTGSARKAYASYRMIQLIEENYENVDVAEARNNFSYLILSTGQGAIKDFLGLPKRWTDIDFTKSVIPKEKIENLMMLFLWLFGDGTRKRAIKESRDITNYLSHIVQSEEAIRVLNATWDVQAAFDISGGEEQLIRTYFTRANSNLEKVLGILHRHRTDLIKKEIDRSAETIETMRTILDGRHS
ncbi:MAG TPA: hypothetical protein PLV08_03120 [Flavobacteriales bacterium]|nr:hypothetical protein [Flavobacteriales bacterium]MBK8531315.1 hypothetical protein [Flavobacteriales bacterium]MBK8708493.1 hypothetical protein [Flavobacteriales bacterium]MBP8877020.1 hypothetical protein [Flavobacteriales bacterium]HQW04846.1 hypothetical protein [Flavobacteriales bacterium]